MSKSKLLYMLLTASLIMSCLFFFMMKDNQTKAEVRYEQVVARDDARVYEGSPDTNYGDEDLMTVGRYESNHMEMWIRFNLTDVASLHGDLKLKSAVLRLRRRGAYGNLTNVQVQVWATQREWSESSITWNNKPSLTTNYTLCAFTGDKFSSTDYRGVPVNKSDVEYWMNSEDKLFSICLTAQGQLDASAFLQVSTKESVYEPSLDLYFGPEGAEPNCQIAVLVDTTIQEFDPSYFQLFATGVEKWFEWWKMDYEEVDVRTTTITQSLLSKYNLVIAAQFNLTMNNNLDSSELQAINASVFEDGVGLVQLDSYLSGYTDVWRDYDRIFDVTVQGYVSSNAKMNLTVMNNDHFITEIYRNGTAMNVLYGQESDLAFERVMVGSSVDVLVSMLYNATNSPALIMKSHGNGRVVLFTFQTGRKSLGFGGCDGFGERPNFKTGSGMHGLLWRSMVWTAKKPFVFMGMPPFITFRVDDVGQYSDPDYIDKLIEYGILTNLFVFVQDVNNKGSAYVDRLRNFYLDGMTHISAHAWTHDHCIYWDRDNHQEYSQSTISNYFEWLDSNFTRWDITSSAYIVPHFHQMGENAIPEMQERGWTLVGTGYRIPYDSGAMSDCWLYDSSFKLSAHADWADGNEKIFNLFNTLSIGDASYPSNDVLWDCYNPTNATKATNQLLTSFEHGLADLWWAEAYTHENKAASISKSDWDKILDQVVGNLTKQYSFTIPASKEYIARYVLNRRHLRISNYKRSGNAVTLNLSGTSNMPTALYLFSDQKITSYSGILDYYRSYGNNGYLLWIPKYSGNHQVKISFDDLETDNPHIHFTTGNVKSTQVNSTVLSIQSSPIGNHTNIKYRFEINCTLREEPSDIKSNGAPINFDYNEKTRLVSFNITLSSLQEITVLWDTEYENWTTSFIGSDGYPIVDITIHDEKLYAAADSSLYIYNGSVWRVTTTPTSLLSVASYENRLCLGGKGGLYSYDGVNYTLVFSVSSYIRPLGVYNNSLYAGTVLDSSPTLYYCNGGAEDPDNWYIDTEFSYTLNFSGPFGSVNSFAVYENQMYVTVEGKIYSFNGTAWSLASYHEGVLTYLDMEVFNGKLYLATRDQGWRKPYYQGGSGFSGRVIEFDGYNWTTIFDHDYWIYSLETYGDKLYMGTANKIYTYNGTNWTISFNSQDGAYHAISLITYTGKIYAGIGNGHILEDPSPEMTGNELIPEVPSLLLPFFIVTTLLAGIFKRYNPLSGNSTSRIRKSPLCYLDPDISKSR